MADQKYWLVWNRDSFVWNKVTLPWNEAYIMEEITSAAYKGGAPGFLLDEEKPWKSLEDNLEELGVSDKVKDGLLEIVVRVNGLDKKITRLSEAKSPKVKIRHVKKTFSQFVPNVKIVTGAVKITKIKDE